MSDSVLTWEEQQGLTIWGEAISAQMRDAGTMALLVREDFPRSTELGHPAILPEGDVRKLHALLNAARGRGAIS
jgi:hypothetical protein